LDDGIVDTFVSGGVTRGVLASVSINASDSASPSSNPLPSSLRELAKLASLKMSKRESGLQRLEVFHEVANLPVTQTQAEERVVVFHHVVERCEAPIVEEPALGVCPQSL
jgi:hypothetical protein